MRDRLGRLTAVGASISRLFGRRSAHRAAATAGPTEDERSPWPEYALEWDDPLPLFAYSPEAGVRGNEAFYALFDYEEEECAAEAFAAWLGTASRSALSKAGQPTKFVVQTSERTVELHGCWTPNRSALKGYCVDVTTVVAARNEAEATCLDLKTKTFLLRKHIAELEEHLEAMVRGFVNAVEAKDPYTAGHSDRVMQYAVRIGEAIGLTQRQLKVLALGALVHDVGKIGIPDAVLMKPGSLSDEEFRIIQTHTEIGARVMGGIPYFEDCMPIIEMHHERLNGEGYPAGRGGEDIPLLVRITTVADVFDALTSTRAYAKALTVDLAIEILENDADSGILDGKIVAVLADIVKRDGALWTEELDQAA